MHYKISYLLFNCFSDKNFQQTNAATFILAATNDPALFTLQLSAYELLFSKTMAVVFAIIYFESVAVYLNL